MEEKRKFVRAKFEATATLGDSETLWEVQVIDISLNGVLVERPEHWRGDLDQEFAFDLPMAGDAAPVVMSCRVARVDRERVGLERVTIGLESITSLRRLMELNTGDPERINREFAELWIDAPTV